MIAEALAGIAVGVIAWYAVPDSTGIGADVLLGLVGGGAGAFIYKLFGHGLAFNGFDGWSLGAAILGAAVLIWVARAAGGRRTIA